MAILTAEKLLGLGARIGGLLDSFQLRGDERVLALLAAAYGEAAQAGMTRQQLSERVTQVWGEIEAQGIGLRR